LNEFVAFARGNADKFSFDDQVSALRVLGVKIYANRADPSGWRYVTAIPIKPVR